jgi:hypothetical protein
MTEMLTAWVRTVVPAAWAAVVAWAVSLGLPPEFSDELNGLAGTLLVPLSLTVVYAAIRWIEPKLPDWLSRLLTGSAKLPSYKE